MVRVGRMVFPPGRQRMYATERISQQDEFSRFF
jgi:hypothetical protein